MPIVVIYILHMKRWSGMNKLVKILFITVFFSLLPVANLFALSTEAKEAIEAIRARLNKNNVNVQVQNEFTYSSDDNEEDYIPGKELYAALARIRRERYAAQNRNSKEESVAVAATVSEADSSTTETTVVNEPETTSQEENTKITDYPLSESNKQSEEVIQSEEITEPDTKEAPSSNDELIIIEALEANDSEAWSIPIDTPSETNTSTTATTKPNNNEYIPGALLKQSVQRIRHSRKSNNPASDELDYAIEEYEKRLANRSSNNSEEVMTKANEEIEELFNNPEKRSRIAEEGRKNYYSQNPETSVSTDEQSIDDDRFNDYISKYKFKMPENYRIIVE